jgi:hypothetical protein
MAAPTDSFLLSQYNYEAVVMNDTPVDLDNTPSLHRLHGFDNNREP